MEELPICLYADVDKVSELHCQEPGKNSANSPMNCKAGQQFVKALLNCFDFSLEISEICHAHFKARVVNEPAGF